MTEDCSAGEWAVDKPWSVFIQWKGTDLCMDFICPYCKEQSHFDGLFAHFIQCPGCYAIYQLKASVEIRRVTPDMAYIDPLQALA